MTTFSQKPRGGVHARHHWLLVAALCAWRVAAAYVLVAPLAAMVKATFGAHPRGDSVLFEPGAEALVDFATRAVPRSATALVEHAVVVVPLLLLGYVLAFGTTVGVLASDEPGARARGRVAFAHAFSKLLPLTGQQIATWLLQGTLIGLALLASGGVASALAPRGLPVAERFGWLAMVPLLLFVPVVDVARDLGAARLLLHGRAPVRAYLEGLARAFARPGLVLGMLWRWAAGVVALVGAAAVATRFGGSPGVAFVIVFLAHQVASALRVALRVSWLAASVRAG